MTTTISGEFAQMASAVDADNPWPGLESFRELDATYFRGRDAQIDELHRLVSRERLTVLYGLSGLGKSSLLQAGLFPQVREQSVLPIYIRLAYDDKAPPPRQQVYDALVREASIHNVETPSPDRSDTLWEYFHRQDSTYWSADNHPLVPLLVFDQFEEAFTLGAVRDRQGATTEFLDELGDLIEGRPSNDVKAKFETGLSDPKAFAFNRHSYKVMLAIRQDFLAELERLKHRRIPSVMSNRMELRPFKGDAALLVTAAGGSQLIRPPGGSELGVGERIVRLVAGEQAEDGRVQLEELVVDPALLSLFCRELNERRKTLHRGSITEDLVKGSREEILASYYQRIISRLPPEVRWFVEERLLTVDDRRDTIALSNALAQPGVTQDAIDTLIARRLIRREERDGRTRLELTHDVLTGVVSQSRNLRRAEEAAQEHAREERQRAEEMKRAAERRVREHREKLEQLQRDAELAESRASAARARAEQREKEAAAARRFIRWVSVLAVVSLGAAVLAGVFLKKARGAQTLTIAMADSIEAANRTLGETNKALGTANRTLEATVRDLRAANERVQMKEQEAIRATRRAIVGAETANEYLGMSWTLIRDMRRADSILVDAVNQADTANASARALSERSALLVAVVDSVLWCDRRSEDSEALARVRTALRERLTPAQLAESFRCASSSEDRAPVKQSLP